MTELEMGRCCRMFELKVFRFVVDRLSYCRGFVAFTQMRAREMLRSGVHGTLEIVSPHPAIPLGGFGVHEEVCHSQSTSHDALRTPHIRPRHTWTTSIAFTNPIGIDPPPSIINSHVMPAPTISRVQKEAFRTPSITNKPNNLITDTLNPSNFHQSK